MTAAVISLALESIDFFRGELHALPLLVVQMFTLFADSLVLRARLVVDHELIHTQSVRFELGLRQNRAAELFETVLNFRG